MDRHTANLARFWLRLFGGISRRLAFSLAAMAAVLGLVVIAAGPAAAQYLFGYPQRGAPQQQQRGFFNDLFPFFSPGPGRDPRRLSPEQHQQQQPRVDYSRAPAPEKRETRAERNILVLGDAMADWLAYGLENAFSEQPEFGVIRRHKTVSGLIRYQPKGEPGDWAAAAKQILAEERPDAIVIMLGLHDRVPISEPAEAKKDPRQKADTATQPGRDPELPPDDPNDDFEAPQIAVPESAARSASGTAAFRDARWSELYSKKIAEMITVLKSKGVPVLWVGLPAVRGTRSTSDMLFLDSLFREGATAGGITFVDVWDGFVDEGGRFMQQGPDFEGQIRRLRTPDGVFFTKAGARKLAHYVEREIARVLTGWTGPADVPAEPETPDPNARQPDGPAPRPLVGPAVPLVAAAISSDQLLGGPGGRSLKVDELATKTLVRGDPLTPPPGRADDFVWPRRDAPVEPARGETPVVAVAPAAARPEAAKQRRPAAGHDEARHAGQTPRPQRPVQRPMLPPPQPSIFGPSNWLTDLFRR